MNNEGTSKEEMLRSHILKRFGSVREFAHVIGMPQSTIVSILRRGIDNANLSSILKICQELSISPDELAKGNIVPATEYVTPATFSVEINEILNATKNWLLQSKGLTLDGRPADENLVNDIIQGIDVAVELAKKKNPL